MASEMAVSCELGKTCRDPTLRKRVKDTLRDRACFG